TGLLTASQTLELSAERDLASQQDLKVRLPKDPLTIYLDYPAPQSRFGIRFIEMPSGNPLNSETVYSGWCADRKTEIAKKAVHEVTLHSSVDSDLTGYAASINWNRINYILNHKQGEQAAIQEALWHMIHGGPIASAEVALMVKNAM